MAIVHDNTLRAMMVAAAGAGTHDEAVRWWRRSLDLMARGETRAAEIFVRLRDRAKGLSDPEAARIVTQLPGLDEALLTAHLARLARALNSNPVSFAGAVPS